MKSIRLALLLLLLFIAGCKQTPRVEPVALSPDYKKGLSFLSSRHDSAYYYFSKAATVSKDSLQIAQAYNMMALVQNREGDYYGAQENLLASLKYLHAERENDQYCLIADYNVLGTSSLNLKNDDAALDYYDRVLGLAKDDRTRTVAMNNKAKVYQEKKQYGAAIAIYDSIIGRSQKDKREYARVLCNLATVRWQADSGYQAAPDLLAALQLRREEKDDWGLNSSYAHLADYYMRSRPDTALVFARAMYVVAGHLGSVEDELEALEKLILLSPSKSIKPYFIAYRRLKDSLETARNGAKNQFALIRYEVEKNKADNLRLLRENAERRTAAVQQRALLAGLIAVFAVSIVWAIGWYRKRKRKMEWEKARVKQEERLQLSQKVHDVVANGIYCLANEVEQAGRADNEPFVNALWGLYEKSRDISYEPARDLDDDLAAWVSGLLSAYGRSDRKVLIRGNEKSEWGPVRREVKAQLEPILQELMINMDKHSGARNVVIRFERERQAFVIQYTDDGVGFPEDFRAGIGLTGTGNRILKLGGRIIFDRNIPTGAKIRIYFPIN